MEQIEVLAVNNSWNKHYVGRIFNVIRMGTSMDNKMCYEVDIGNGQTEVFEANKCRQIKG